MMMTHALKEWAVAINALVAGETVVLLRKGGIREEGGRFRVAHDQMWLYPTYEHQKPHLLKPAYANQVEPVASGWHPESVAIAAWAEITQVFQISDPEVVSALQPFHIWNELFVTERFHWKPRQPLYILMLRVHRLDAIHTIPYRSDYGGCQSWIDLADAVKAIAPELSTPAVADTAYAELVHKIASLVHD
jgi:hypothetical protein